MSRLEDERRRIQSGGAEKYHERLRASGKLFARDRLRLLLDEDSFTEDGLHASGLDPQLPADGVVTGVGRINGRPVAVMANDATVKAGSWGPRTVEKILRVQERAAKLKVPLVYLVDSAGARITDQVEMFPGRRGAGRIFYHQVRLSGVVPQVCLLFGPSAAGGAYIPAFTDLNVMVDQNASMYLGSPRMAEMVIGEHVTLEEMGGARMHTSVSGCGDVLAESEEDAIQYARRYLAYFPGHFEELPPVAHGAPPEEGEPIASIIPEGQNAPFDMKRLIRRVVDGGSFLEIKARFAPEIICGLARLDGMPVGVVANQPAVRGGVLFSDSADKAARFIMLMDAFNLPLVFLADVPGFMIGSQVERGGIIRHGAKLISAVADCGVPKLSVIVRKAYGAGLYAMAGPAYDPVATIALERAQIAVMGPEAAINAVYFNRIRELPEADRAAFVAEKRKEYTADIDVFRLAGELVVDDVIAPDELRETMLRRLRPAFGTRQAAVVRHRPVPPV